MGSWTHFKIITEGREFILASNLQNDYNMFIRSNLNYRKHRLLALQPKHTMDLGKLGDWWKAL